MHSQKIKEPFYIVTFHDEDDNNIEPSYSWSFETKDEARTFTQNFYERWENLDESFLKYEARTSGFILVINKITPPTNHKTHDQIFDEWFKEFYE